MNLKVVVGCGILVIVVVICFFKLSTSGKRQMLSDTEMEAAKAIWSRSPVPFDEDKAEKFFQEFNSGKLKDDGGVIELPGDLSSITDGGRVYVTQEGTTIRAFLFITKRGKGSNLEGFIYCPNATETAPGKDYPVSMTVLGPKISKAGLTVCKIEVAVEKMPLDGWFAAYRDMD